ncbi:MAG: hypothetical protein UY97_C0001G0120 [Parcubacteria group bacterium GW2011_GWB1_57_6]|nr:MAG: hypothetical protein UY93_C0004G0010 [Parcubacteria group bacterium GW2011_GWA1_56_13]KKW47063.1 MAG: hypothetical protein UY97_C0001G0120 [Parcubacteria group bacterium GW2011_GWB1_57_6]
MGHDRLGIGQSTEIQQMRTKVKDLGLEDFVLENSIFNNVFEKDIRRVFIYKKAERLAKAIHLIAPAFAESLSLRNRVDSIAVGLVDAALLSPGAARTALSRELLALSSVLSIASTGGLLSSMNAGLMAREAHVLLQEVASYEEPRLTLADTPTLSTLAKLQHTTASRSTTLHRHRPTGKVSAKAVSGIHIKDRGEAILSIIKDKQKVSIKDISTLIRGVSEKTIQRELLALISLGKVTKQGERRWSTYSPI